ncbi:MAG: hypothetical protein CME65_11460 [Halobacteriovoraceae bacterium]|nr:hypothetical protein [Halobacteriovoraceae bacterium]|tara:strand:- start:18862 stop:19647 length:786 start_codon:yes stop_codon:yes gene_type:complete
MIKELIFSLAFLLFACECFSQVDDDIKFLVSRDIDLKKIEHLLDNNFRIHFESVEVEDVYYDNAEYELFENNFSLRVRSYRSKQQIHFKFPTSKGMGEIQTPVGLIKNDSDLISNLPADIQSQIKYLLLKNQISFTTFLPQFKINQKRKRMYLSQAGQRIYTISYDKVFYQDNILLLELELELSEKITDQRDKWNEKTQEILNILKDNFDLGERNFRSKYQIVFKKIPLKKIKSGYKFYLLLFAGLFLLIYSLGKSETPKL